MPGATGSQTLSAARPLPLLALLSLAGSAAVTLLTELLPAGVLPQMSAALQVPPARIGFLASGYAAAAAVAAIPFTALARALPRRPLVAGLLLALAVADVAVAASTCYLITLAVRVIAGVANGMLWSMLASYAAGIVPAQQRGRAVAVTLAGITVTLSAGVPGATWLAGWLGWRPAFVAVGALAALMAGCVRCTVPWLGGSRRTARTGPGAVARLPGVRAALAITGLLIAGHQTMYSYIALVARGYGIGHASLALLVFGCGAVAGIWVTGALIDRHLRPVLLCAVALIAASMLTMTQCAGHPAAALCTIGFWGLGFGGAPTLIQTALIDAAGACNADLVSSLQTSTYNAAIGGGSLLGGVALGLAGVAVLPWAAFCLTAAALFTAAAGHVRRSCTDPAGSVAGGWARMQVGPSAAGREPSPQLDEGVAVTAAQDGFHRHLYQVASTALSGQTAQTGGMTRREAISGGTVGSRDLWMGQTHVAPSTASANHHHGVSETGIYVVSGHPEFVFLDEIDGHPAERRLRTSPGDYIYVPPWVPHREENPDPDDEAIVVIARTTQEAIVVNLADLTWTGPPGV
jgi:predicted MFS family arabinose efflux permease/uncharacterized RmlC-like cupin family protein